MRYGIVCLELSPPGSIRLCLRCPMLPRTRLIEVSLGGLCLLLVAGAYMHSREVAVKADAEHQANVVLQDQLQKMRSDLQKQITDRDTQYKKDTSDLQHRFDAASKDRAKMAALLSQLAKLP